MLQGSPLSFDDSTKFPAHLQDYNKLTQHFRAHLADFDESTKGDLFAHFAAKVIPQTSIGSDYDHPQLNSKKSRDEGVDMTAEAKDKGHKVYIQSKLWVDRSSMIDTVISKFEAYHQKHFANIDEKGQLALPLEEEGSPHFLLITLSPLKGILESYESKRLSSRHIYDRWIDEQRIHFIDGIQILRELQTAYRKLGEVPVNLTVRLAYRCIEIDNVYLGAISSDELKSLYNEYGDSLFFENIRDFLGVSDSPSGRTTPNEEILRTITDAPEKMLERNNGIVIRADSVEVADDGKELYLSKGSVVNGCQTTMCMIKFAQETCYVPFKVVETDQSWEITKAANFQASVPDIDLELARVLRPQLARRAAITSGVRVDAGEPSAFQLIDEIYRHRVAYDETRSLFIGLFSRLPNNIFDSNYTELVPSLINHFYKSDPHGQQIFDTVFLIQEGLRRGTEGAEQTLTGSGYAERYKRFFKPDSPTYRCFVCLLALSAAIGMDLADRKPDPDEEFERMRDFLEKTRMFLEERPERFVRYFILATKTWMQTVWPPGVTDAEGSRDMSVLSRRAPFSGMLDHLQMDADLDDWLKRESEDYQSATKPEN